MGTNNFYYKNATRIYAICTDQEVDILDEDGNETGETGTEAPDEWQVRETLDNIRDRIEENTKYRTDRLEGWSNDAPRSFPCTLLGTWAVEKTYAGVSVEAIITATANSGYYEAACLDWEVKTYVAGYERDEVDAEDMAYYSDKLNKGLGKVMAGHANKWLGKMKDQLSEDMEKLFEELCEVKARHIGSMSNGEGVYKVEEKAKP